MPDSPDLSQSLRAGVMRLARRLRAEKADHELSDSQFVVLALLLRDGPTSPGRLAEVERVTAPSMNRTVNCLVEAGYAERSPAPDDGRRVTVSITGPGQRVVQETRRQRSAWLSLRLAELTADERATLGEAAVLLGRMAAA
ncbi:DNA-binding MarR family transcriptional regulator [Clavibacter michiganensis]|uniref:MarR family winged helix-turn-helix transcriptional regulator n=1 Tax=Clavibacter michiganensis TaxID=28447 RepID=UPI001AE737B3|nr:MarR family transcriptional regulator [Clavibacter michiganensis]MBP2457754.1 DNA-binding MarR family transcriptional regulator [Clavibacter michiganensis]MDQ0410324.1 DNA-binding MarR family transcriptional regulator [Clavibacter michiganensis]